MDMLDESTHQGAAMAEFRDAIATDLRLLAFLHDAEPEAAVLEELRAQPFQACLGFKLTSPIGCEGLEIFDRALGSLPQPITPEAIDDLGVEYANIYLTYAYRASPCESVWFDDDGLERQQPMFEVRECYRDRGFATADPRKRPDDHLVFQLLFVARLIEDSAGDQGLRDACRFMDEHLLKWLGQFCGRAAARCRSSYFAGMLLVTGAYVDELRNLLEEALGVLRPKEPPAEESRRQQASACNPDPANYIPGTGPGW